MGDSDAQAALHERSESRVKKPQSAAMTLPVDFVMSYYCELIE